MKMKQHLKKIWEGGLLLAIAIILFPKEGISEKSHLDSDPKPSIVFIVSNDPLNYEAYNTIPKYAGWLEEQGKYQVQVIEAIGERRKAHLPDIKAIKKADLLVVFCRRLAFKPKQMKILKDYVRKGNPVVGLRTANHAFSIRDSLPEGYVDWWDFVPDVLGCENRGYEPEELGTIVRTVDKNKTHQILDGIESDGWRSNGQVYKVAPLIDQNAKILLTGSTENVTEPFAWIRTTKFGGKVFYTALGYPDDFENDNFIKLITNGIEWAIQ